MTIPIWSRAEASAFLVDLSNADRNKRQAEASGQHTNLRWLEMLHSERNKISNNVQQTTRENGKGIIR